MVVLRRMLVVRLRMRVLGSRFKAIIVPNPRLLPYAIVHRTFGLVRSLVIYGNLWNRLLVYLSDTAGMLGIEIFCI